MLLSFVSSINSGQRNFRLKELLICSVKSIQYITNAGLAIAAAGIILRVLAEVKMEANFSHIIQSEKSSSHQLVTSGVYSIFRHPSYTGWYYYLVGREIILHNVLGFVITSSLFCFLLKYRIAYFFIIGVISSYEEKFLRNMFEEYESYSKRTHVFIPFI